MNRSTTHRTARFGAIVVSVALFAACGGDDDDAASEVTQAETSSASESTSVPTTTEAPAAEGTTSIDDAATTTTEAPQVTTTEASSATTEDSATADTADTGAATADDTGDDTGETIEIDDFGDLPEECRNLFGDFLRDIEPTVSEIDWDNATMADFETLSTQLQTQSDSFDDQIAAANCDDYDIGENAESVQAMIDFAEDEAPGTVGYLEFLASFLEDFSGDGSGGDMGAADVPTDCEGAIAYIDALIAEHDTMMDMPVNSMMAVSTAVTNISSNCPAAQAQEFFARTDVTDFMGG